MFDLLVEYAQDSVPFDNVISYTDLEHRIRNLYCIEEFTLQIKDMKYGYFRNLKARYLNDHYFVNCTQMNLFC